jgi:hypothetical protein
MPATPIAIRTTRYRCPFCARSRSRRATTTAHIARCWHNPETRSCLTCEHHDAGGDACGCEPGCNWGAPGPVPPSCGVGLDLGENSQPVSNCPQWQTAIEGETA